MNRYLAEAEEERWAKRERQWNKEAAARNALMKEVMNTRREQVAFKQRRRELEKDQDQVFAKLEHEKYLRMVEQEKEKQADLRAAASERRRIIQMQIEEKK